MPKKKPNINNREDLHTRDKEFRNEPKYEDEKRQQKETPGVSGKFSGR